MSSVAAFVPKTFLSVLLVASALPAQTTDSATPPADSTTPSATSAAPEASGVSKIRIVRLSEVKGVVQLDRNIGRGFEPVMANMPIVENARLRTDQGAAEVEFEDNSTLRLAPDSEVAFPQLERQASGATASSVQVLKGTVYASMVKTKGNEFNLLFGSQKIELTPSSHIRLQLGNTDAKLAVLDGDVQIAGPSGALNVPKKKTVTFQLQAQSRPQVAKDVEEGAFDTWDKQSAEYHARTASLMGSNGSPYSYGLNDMSYYGSFADVGGCGSMWRPYFVSADWSPFTNGAWAYYPGGGYSWVSPYPWGWTPYHYGSWSFCSGAGWGWTPGGGWYGLNNFAMLNNGLAPYQAGSGGSGRILPPPHPPRVGEPTITAVNLKPLVRSGLASQESFEFRKDSAGLGIPRDGLGKLDKLSRQSLEKGTAHTEVYLSAPTMTGRDGRPTNTLAPTAVHRGPAPQASGESYSRSYSGGGPSHSSGAAPSYSSSSHASAPAAAGAPSAPSGGGSHH